MKALVWHGQRDVRVDHVPDPSIQEATDAIVRVTSSGICGSDLHLYEVLAPFMREGDVLGHEPMGIVEAVGAGVGDLKVGDRVVVPFQIACGHCFMCDEHLYSQCETTQVTEQGTGAALFGYSTLYGEVPGGQAEYLRVPHADFGPIKVPHEHADDRFVYLSDVLPTAWQAVSYAGVQPGSSVAVLGLGPIGDMATRVAQHQGAERVFGVDLVPARLERAAAHGVEVIDLREGANVGDELRERTFGRGPDAVIDAVGMEAHGDAVGKLAHRLTSLLPAPVAAKLMRHTGIDRMAALYTAIDAVRRGGTISLVGVYGGMSDPLPMQVLFDKQIQLRMGQANVRAWTDEILPLVTGDGDPLGVDTFASHRLRLEDGPGAYRDFQHKRDDTVKVLLQPAS